MTKTYCHNGLAGCVDQRTNRKTGFKVGLYHTEQAGLDSCNGSCKWSTICEEHGTILGYRTLSEARSFMSHPDDWCEECQDVVSKRGHS